MLSDSNGRYQLNLSQQLDRLRSDESIAPNSSNSQTLRDLCCECMCSVMLLRLQLWLQRNFDIDDSKVQQYSAGTASVSISMPDEADEPRVAPGATPASESRRSKRTARLQYRKQIDLKFDDLPILAPIPLTIHSLNRLQSLASPVCDSTAASLPSWSEFLSIEDEEDTFTKLCPTWPLVQLQFWQNELLSVSSVAITAPRGGRGRRAQPKTRGTTRGGRRKSARQRKSSDSDEEIVISDDDTSSSSSS